jgi:hypothetical protein
MGGQLLMQDNAVISGNTATGYGGGVSILPDGLAAYDSRYLAGITVQGGVISGNSAYRGGGVSVGAGRVPAGGNGPGILAKTASSVIYGGDAVNAAQRNTAAAGGNAVWVSADDANALQVKLENTVAQGRALNAPSTAANGWTD